MNCASGSQRELCDPLAKSRQATTIGPKAAGSAQRSRPGSRDNGSASNAEQNLSAAGADNGGRQCFPSGAGTHRPSTTYPTANRLYVVFAPSFVDSGV